MTKTIKQLEDQIKVLELEKRILMLEKEIEVLKNTNSITVPYYPNPVIPSYPTWYGTSDGSSDSGGGIGGYGQTAIIMEVK